MPTQCMIAVFYLRALASKINGSPPAIQFGRGIIVSGPLVFALPNRKGAML